MFDYSHVHFATTISSAEKPGVCLDIGAPRSVLGLKELHKILNHVRRSKIPIVSSANKFRFGDVVVPSRGIIELCLKTPLQIPEIMVLMDFVPVDVPALFGFDVLDSESLCADNVTNYLVHRFLSSRSSDILEYDDIWSVPIIRRVLIRFGRTCPGIFLPRKEQKQRALTESVFFFFYVGFPSLCKVLTGLFQKHYCRNSIGCLLDDL